MKETDLKNQKLPELLSPAGSYDGFTAAISGGADAVYAGGRAFGARAYAANFSDEELLKAIDMSHLLVKRFYLTVNTLCKEREFQSLYDYLLPLYKAGLDGVIVQDIGVISFIRDTFPSMEVHASTQMTLTGSLGAKYLKSLGATRIVPARELSLTEIEKIHNEVDIEIETFIHGAMCYCYSGQCLMSSFLGGRSGNRGRCAQPCRLPYESYVDGKRMGGTNESYVLSMKDLCTLKIIPDLIDAGITSFKIEGRMKKPEYTGFVTSMYRKYIDLYLEKGKKGYKVTDEDFNTLTDFYKRADTQEGYYRKHNGRSLITLYKPSYESENHNAQFDSCGLTVPVNAHGAFIAGENASLTLECGSHSVTAYGEKCQMALNRPLSKEDIARQLSKVGGSIFSYDKLKIESSGSIFMPVSAINELRRSAFDNLSSSILESFKRDDYLNCGSAFAGILGEASSSDDKTAKKSVLVSTKRQLEAVCNALKRGCEIGRIYVELSLFKTYLDFIRSIASSFKDHECSIYVALPHIFRADVQSFTEKVFEGNSSIAETADGFLVRNYEELMWCREHYCSLKVVCDHNMYTFNSYSCSRLLKDGASELSYPLELNSHELAERGYSSVSEFLIYGRNNMMISAGCIRKTVSACNKQKSNDPAQGKVFIKDRLGKVFPVITECDYCYNRILNSVPISLLGKRKSVLKLKPASVRYEFTDESFDEVISILCDNLEPGEYTRGHFIKSVE